MEDTLNQQIKHFYDRSTPIWLDTWGEHMHHGYYGADGSERKDHRQAQLDLVEEMLYWGGVDHSKRVLDAGCGVGGSARYLAKRFDCAALGLTLSTVQAEQARQYTVKASLENSVQFQVRDMMTLSASDGPFDLVWSMESAEHIRDKQQLFHVFYEVLTHGGHFLMATWCHRPVPPDLSKSDQKLLEKIGKLYHLPPMVSRPALEIYAATAGFMEVTSADWSRAVEPFWQAVIKTALRWRSIGGLLRAGWPTIKGAWAMRYMQQGFKRGLIEFVVLQGRKV
ncbi:MAG: class I SAM-dependent methyltransferase [Phycisphaerae bacterium]|nr:class I SAM-dependent methyltransferase [Saprospiraceae bacterium]